MLSRASLNIRPNVYVRADKRGFPTQNERFQYNCHIQSIVCKYSPVLINFNLVVKDGAHKNKNSSEIIPRHIMADYKTIN